MANRMQKNGVLGCVVSGRVRDLAELKSSGLPVRSSASFLSPYLSLVRGKGLSPNYVNKVFARARSTVGTGAEAKVLARNCPIKIRDVDVNPVSFKSSITLKPTKRLFFSLPLGPSLPSLFPFILPEIYSFNYYRATSSSVTHSKASSLSRRLC